MSYRPSVFRARCTNTTGIKGIDGDRLSTLPGLPEPTVAGAGTIPLWNRLAEQVARTSGDTYSLRNGRQPEMFARREGTLVLLSGS